MRKTEGFKGAECNFTKKEIFLLKSDVFLGKIITSDGRFMSGEGKEEEQWNFSY